MAEQGEVLRIRRSELSAQARQATQRMATLMAHLPSFVSPQNVDSIKDTINTIKFQERISADCNWVIALAEAGLSPEQICQIWDLKDSNVRDIRDRITDQRSAL